MNTDKLKNIEKDKMLPKSKTRLAVQRERARLRMCNLRQRRRVEELPEQRKTRLASERESRKKRRAEESGTAQSMIIVDVFKSGLCSRVGKPDNLFIYTDNGTAKNVVYSQVLRS